MVNQKISQFLSELKSDDGSLACIGGHYAWPSLPTEHAIRSAKQIVTLKEVILPDKSFIFIDDIGASASCNDSYVCKPVDNQSHSLEISGLADWVQEALDQIELTVIKNLNPSQKHINNLLKILGAVDKTTAGHPVVVSLKSLSEKLPQNLDQWLLKLEMLIYLTVRESFRPLLLSKYCNTKLPDIYFEKSTNNKASKMLHRLKKGNIQTNLQVSEDEGVNTYWLMGGLSKNKIELRVESPEKVANKCSALISQLFFWSCRNLIKLNKGSDRLVIFYIIPCYDRKRIRDGMEAFFGLYRDLNHWFNAREVVLISGFFVQSENINILCDVGIFSQNSSYVEFYSKGLKF